MNGDGRREREGQLTQYAAETSAAVSEIYDLAATFREVGAATVQTILQEQNGDFFIPAAVNTAFAVGRDVRRDHVLRQVGQTEAREHRLEDLPNVVEGQPASTRTFNS